MDAHLLEHGGSVSRRNTFWLGQIAHGWLGPLRTAILSSTWCARQFQTTSSHCMAKSQCFSPFFSATISLTRRWLRNPLSRCSNRESTHLDTPSLHSRGPKSKIQRTFRPNTATNSLPVVGGISHERSTTRPTGSKLSHGVSPVVSTRSLHYSTPFSSWLC